MPRHSPHRQKQKRPECLRMLHSTNLTFDLVELHGLKWFNFSMSPTGSRSPARAVAVSALIGGWSNGTWQRLGVRRSSLKFVQDPLVSIVLMSNSFGAAF